MSALPEIQPTIKPHWLKVKFPSHKTFFYVSNTLKKGKLNTICRSAKCPNVAECWSRKTAAFLILGETCTRGCAFCAVEKGSPSPPSPDEPEHVAEAVSLLGLRYAVITSRLPSVQPPPGCHTPGRGTPSSGLRASGTRWPSRRR